MTLPFVNFSKVAACFGSLNTSRLGFTQYVDTLFRRRTDHDGWRKHSSLLVGFQDFGPVLLDHRVQSRNQLTQWLQAAINQRLRALDQRY